MMSVSKFHQNDTSEKDRKLKTNDFPSPLGTTDWLHLPASQLPKQKRTQIRSGQHFPKYTETAHDQVDSVIDWIQDAIRDVMFKGDNPCPNGYSASSARSAALTPIGLDLKLRVRIVHTLLLGEVTCDDRQYEASLVGIDPDGAYIPFRARTRPGCLIEELVAELILGTSSCGEILAAELDGDIIGLLPHAPLSVSSGAVGVGPAARPGMLAESFPLASRALETAIALDLDGVHAFNDLGLLPAIVTDPEMGETLWLRYVQPFDDVKSGAEIMSVIWTWFRCGMHVDRAAALAMLHPNTVRNRIAQFESVVGVDLRDSMVAMQVWWALHYGALAGASAPRLGTNAMLSL